MKKNEILAVVLNIAFSAFVFSAGEAESGRSSAIDMIGSDSYVASSYLDLDSILDDYSYPYSINTEESLSFDVSASYSSVLAIGGKIELQVSVKTNDFDYFPETDFNYIIYIGNSGLLGNTEYHQALTEGIKSIFRIKPRSSRIFFYFKKDGVIKELVSQTALSSMLQEIEGQYNFKLEEKSDDYDKKAKEDLSLLLKAAPENGNPNKFFWIFNKRIAKSARDVSDIFSIIAGLGGETAEISFCGFSEKFRAATVNTIVNQFGGNSYYFKNGDDLIDIITDDYRFYLYPAVSNLKISIHSLEKKTAIDPVVSFLLSRNYYGIPELTSSDPLKRAIKVKSMGADEYHTYLTSFDIPSQQQYLGSNSNSSFNRESTIFSDNETSPYAIVLIEYLDQKTGKYIYSSAVPAISYTDSYEVQMETLDPYVNRNVHIRDTYLLINEISRLLQQGNYQDPLVKLNSQIERLEYLNRNFNDPMINEDIEMLRKYKDLIYENKEKPFRGLKAFSELSLKQY